MDFQPDQRVDVVMRGTMVLGGATFTNCSFGGVTIARKNPDGSYQVRGLVRTPTSDEITIPAEWIRAA